MLEARVIVILVVLSVAVGFAAYCLSCAGHVWKARNRATGRPRGLVGWATGLLAILGLIGVGTTVGQRALTDRNGEMIGHGLHAVRVPESLAVADVTEGPEVEANAVLAQFGSPQQVAEIDALSQDLDAIDAERRALIEEPMVLDAQLLRRRDALREEQRHVWSALSQQLVERNRIARDRGRDQMSLQEQWHRLRIERDTYAHQADQARVRFEAAATRLDALEALHQANAVAMDDYRQQVAEVHILEQEAVKMHQLWQRTQAETNRHEAMIRDLSQVTEEQLRDLGLEIDRLGSRWEASQAEQQELTGAIEADRLRAQRWRQAQLDRVDARHRQATSRLAGLRDSSQERAPYGGRIVYRDPSPRSARPGKPILVLAPPDGLIFQIRLPNREARAIPTSEPIRLELTDRSVHGRFFGRWIQTNPLPGDPGAALVELGCDPPSHCLSDLVEGKLVRARLLWSAPLWTFPMVWVGLGCGVIALLIAVPWRGVSRNQPESESAMPPSFEPPVPTTEPAEPEASLRRLKKRLEDAIRRGHVERGLLDAIEGALTRHDDAARWLCPDLEDDVIAARLAALLDRGGSKARRLQTLLSVLCPQRFAAAPRTVPFREAEELVGIRAN